MNTRSESWGKSSRVRLALSLLAAVYTTACAREACQSSPAQRSAREDGLQPARAASTDTEDVTLRNAPARDGGQPTGGAIGVERIIVHAYRTNCYLLSDVHTKKALVVDPADEPRRIYGAIKGRGLTVEAIVETHGHPDHTGGSAMLQELTGAPLFRHPSRVTARDRPRAKALEHGAKLAIGALRFEVLHTPGHDPGSLCLLGEGVLVSGDLLFKGSVGRTDFPGGDARQLQRSILEVLAKVPDQTVVLPGHGDPTTMGEERRTNPFLVRDGPEPH